MALTCILLSVIMTAVDLAYLRWLHFALFPEWKEWTVISAERFTAVTILYSWTYGLNASLYWSVSMGEAAREQGRRVAIAEISARTGAVRARVDQLDRERSELLVEASRRDAERARAEAERLRIEAQVQAEESARLRAQAEQAQAVLDTAQIDQGARVAAAREKEAALARQEAELTAGASLPPSRQDGQGEVFTLAGDAFGSGQAQLTGNAAASLRALAVYLTAMGSGNVQVLGHTDSQGEADANRALSQRRAEAVRNALIEAGLSANRIRAEGQGEDAPVADNMTASGRARNRRVDIVVAN